MHNRVHKLSYSESRKYVDTLGNSNLSFTDEVCNLGLPLVYR